LEIWATLCLFGRFFVDGENVGNDQAVPLITSDRCRDEITAA
jgi:hypothetical protein